MARLYAVLKFGYISHKYGYSRSWLNKFCGMPLYLFPLRRTEIDADMRYLPHVADGRLLDIGCGSGDWLKRMCELGWRGEGTDFDAAAVDIARTNGLQVHYGALKDLDFPRDTFDAITMNHVIEHVPDPIALIAECWRILKPGGRIVLATPNIESLGHRIFKEHWRGLEPPRHLHVLSPASVYECLTAVGFKSVVLRTHNSKYVLAHSHRLATGGDRDAKQCSRWLPTMLAVLEQFALTVRPKLGECINASGVKLLAKAA